MIIVSWNKVKTFIDPAEIVYIERLNRQTVIYLDNGQVYKTSVRLDLLELPAYFLRTHKSYFVNTHKVRTVKRNELFTEDNRRIPVSRKNIETVRERFFEMYLKGEFVYHY